MPAPPFDGFVQAGQRGAACRAADGQIRKPKLMTLRVQAGAAHDVG